MGHLITLLVPQYTLRPFFSVEQVLETQ